MTTSQTEAYLLVVSCEPGGGGSLSFRGQSLRERSCLLLPEAGPYPDPVRATMRADVRLSGGPLNNAQRAEGGACRDPPPPPTIIDTVPAYAGLRCQLTGRKLSEYKSAYSNLCRGQLTGPVGISSLF